LEKTRLEPPQSRAQNQKIGPDRISPQPGMGNLAPLTKNPRRGENFPGKKIPQTPEKKRFLGRVPFLLSPGPPPPPIGGGFLGGFWETPPKGGFWGKKPPKRKKKKKKKTGPPTGTPPVSPGVFPKTRKIWAPNF